MVIDRVGGIGPGYEPRKPEPVAKQIRSGRTDNVEISEEAARAAELARVERMARLSEDSARTEKVEEVKMRLAEGVYDNPSDEVLDQVSDRLASAFLG